MMKNRAGLLALLVLAIAAVVMIFFVLPNREDAQQMADNAVKSVSETAGDAAEKAGRLTDNLSSPEVLEKMERLKSEAEAAAEALQALFANGRIPTNEEIAEAKTKAEAALQAMAEFEAPEGLEAAVGDVVSSMKEKASKALDMVKSMPEDAESAAKAMAGLGDLLGTPATNETAAAEAEAPAAPAGVVPAFDILRVEKDGSTVLAGVGTPGAKIDLLSGDDVIASDTVGEAGDFAIVLDTPLSAGDHQLVLRTTTPDGTVATSQEVATVSVPQGEDGELLAMVSKPGEASRILTMPETSESASTATEADAGTETSAEAATEEIAQAPATENTGEAADQPMAADTAVPGMPPLPDASSVLVGSAPIAPGDAATVSQSADASIEAPVATNAEIRVSAVELEGNKMFVAGSAKPGATVRVYADDQLIGEAVADAEGNFVADGSLELSVGNHIIRADVVENGSGKVIVRASVPFNRPEGEQVAVVARTGEPAANAAVNGEAATRLVQLREEVAKALVLLKGLFADGKTPSADELAAARSAAKIALGALAAFKPADDADGEFKASAEKAASSAAEALKVLDGAAADAAAVANAIPNLETAASDAIAPALETEPASNGAASMATSNGGDSAEAANEAPAADNAAGEMASTEAASEPKTIEQAPLEASDSAVIIRKGDTLWQISRRIYGKGIRYTTIYLANQGDITDPNMINPGQVFKLPDEMLEDDSTAEETNRKLQSQ